MVNRGPSLIKQMGIPMLKASDNFSFTHDIESKDTFLTSRMTYVFKISLENNINSNSSLPSE